MKKLLLCAFSLLLFSSNQSFALGGTSGTGTGTSLTAGAGGGGVSSLTGDGVLFNNSASTGAVTLTKANAGANTVLGNATGSGAIPTYTAAPILGTSLQSPLVFIGTSAAGTNANLSVNGGATFGTYGGNSTAAPSNGMIVSGSVGIGTNNPLNTLEVEVGATTGGGITIDGSSAPAFGISVSNTGRFQFGAATGNGNFSGIAVTGDDVLTSFSGSYIISNQANGAIKFSTGTSGSDTLKVIIPAAGGMGIGTATLRNSALLDVNGGLNVSGSGVFMSGLTSDATFTDNTLCDTTATGAIHFGSGTLGICLGTSSLRYKNPVGPVSDGLAQIMALKPENFFYKKGYGDSGAKEQYGFYAEDVIQVLPKLTGLDKDGKPNTVDMLGMIPVLTKAIQEQQSEINALKRQISKH